MKQLLFAALLVGMLTACDQQKTAADQQNTQVPSEQKENRGPEIPILSVNQILDLSKNEFNEIERRCLGARSETCTNMKSESYTTLRDLRKSLCETGRLLDGKIEERCKIFYQ